MTGKTFRLERELLNRKAKETLTEYMKQFAALGYDYGMEAEELERLAQTEIRKHFNKGDA